jgi:hypothetical protein
MPEFSLHDLEREVEAARAKLAGDLSTLRSPTTTKEFTEILKQEALQAKDTVVNKAKDSAQSTVQSVVEDIKARAAANPAAALAIGAGIAWRLIRHPPIATALVGAGIWSLYRTPPARTDGQVSPAHLSDAKKRLAEQASELADLTRDEALALGRAAAVKAEEAVGRIKPRVQDLTTQSASAARRVATEASQKVQGVWSGTTEALEQAGHSAHSAASRGISRASDAVESWMPTRSAVESAGSRDNILLGAAGLAVATALGFAWRRRMKDDADPPSGMRSRF